MVLYDSKNNQPVFILDNLFPANGYLIRVNSSNQVILKIEYSNGIQNIEIKLEYEKQIIYSAVNNAEIYELSSNKNLIFLCTDTIENLSSDNEILKDTNTIFINNNPLFISRNGTNPFTYINKIDDNLLKYSVEFGYSNNRPGQQRINKILNGKINNNDEDLELVYLKRITEATEATTEINLSPFLLFNLNSNVAGTTVSL